MSWLELKCAVTEELREPIGSRLFDMGACGLEEREEKGGIWIHSYFEKAKKESLSADFSEFLKSLAKTFPSAKIPTFEIVAVRDEKWAESYKKFFSAHKISENFYLVPEWEKHAKVPESFQTIRMDPGQAFGTGLHATTRLCVRMLERLLGSKNNSKTSVLDVGTGTGILAIVAKKLGCGRVVATDNDPIAVEVAEENMKTNSCAGVEVSGKALQDFKETFQIVVANILLETHIQLRDTYRKVLEPRGTLILSGLLAGQDAVIVESFSKVGFVLEVTNFQQEWVALQFYRQ